MRMSGGAGGWGKAGLGRTGKFTPESSFNHSENLSRGLTEEFEDVRLERSSGRDNVGLSTSGKLCTRLFG